MSQQNPLSHVTNSQNQIDTLNQSGFTSAFQIATTPRSRFIQQHEAKLGGNDQAAEIHRKAVSRTAQVAEQFVSQRLTIDESYWDVPPDRTIFSPAAYLVDLVRFIENYVEDEQVAPTQTLFFRRPDLDYLLLDEQTTETIIPKLDLVNELLEGHLAWSQPLPELLRPFAKDSLEYYLLFHYGDRNILSKDVVNLIALGKNPITLNEGGSREYAANRFGVPAAFKFNGSTYLTLSDLAPDSKFTFFAWVWLSSESSGALFSDATPNIYTNLHIEDLDGGKAMRFRYETGNLDPLRTVPTEQWVHLALTMDDSGHVVYVNGVEVLRMSYVQYLGSEWRIGEHFVGIMDSVGVYNEVLSPEEIAAFAAHHPREQVYQHLAGQAYAFKPPFHLPRAQLRTALALLKTDLAAIYRTFNPGATLAQAAVSAEKLKLSPEAVAVCTTPKPSQADLQNAYGLTSSFDSAFVIVNEGLDSEHRAVDLTLFLHLTGLSAAQLNDLLHGDLSAQEIKDGVQRKFFINADHSPLAPVQIDVESSRLTNLSLARLDRIHRFVLLANQVGWSFSDLDWALRTADAATSAINELSLAVVAQLVDWQNRFQRSIPELCSLIGVLKNEGDAQARNLHSDVTFADNPRVWQVEQNDPEQRKTSLALAAALGLSESDLMLVAKRVGTAFTGSNQLSFPLELESLSAFYRLSRLPQLLGMSLAETLSLGELMGDSHLNTLAGPPTSAIANSLNQLSDYQQWIRSANIPVGTLSYILTGNTSDSYPLRLDRTRVVNFINDFANSTTNAKNKESRQKSVEHHLADLVGVSAETITHLIRWANTTLQIKEAAWLDFVFPDTGNSPLVDAVALPDGLVAYLTQLHRYACLVNLLRITAAELAFVLDHPTFFNIQNMNTLTLADVRSLYQFKWLIYRFQDQQNGLIGYLKSVNKFITPTELASILNLDPNNFQSDALEAIHADDYPLTFRIIDSHDQLPELGKRSVFVGITRSSQIYVRIFGPQGERLTPEDGKALLVENKRDAQAIFIAAETALMNGSLDRQTQNDILKKILPNLPNLTNVWAKLVEKRIINQQGRILITHQEELNLGIVYKSYESQVWSLFATRIDQTHAIHDLARLTQWESDQSQFTELSALISHLWSHEQDNTETFTYSFGTVAGILQMYRCFDLSAKTGLSHALLWQIQQNLASPKDDLNAAYQSLSDTADLVLAAVKAKYSDTDWEKVYQPMRVDLNEQKRDALVDAVILRHGLAGIAHNNRQGLYDYLLIDVAVSGLVETSRLVEALASLQLYIYRWQMQLEGPTALDPDFEQYWSWIKNYRLWEANRKVFLYPENYLQPELRKNKTTLFAQFEQNLQQTHINAETVDKAFKNYLNGLAEVANLKYAGSYAAPTEGGTVPGYPNRTLYLVGRSRYPYKYYYRETAFAYDHAANDYHPVEWQSWIEIALSIPAKYSSPIYAFNRLFLFWVEIKPAAAQRNSDGKMTSKRFEAQIQFSCQDFSKNWMTPQPLGEPILLPEAVNSKSKAESSDWQRISLSYDESDRLIYVGYPGFFTALDVTLKQVIPTPIAPLTVEIDGDGNSLTPNQQGQLPVETEIDTVIFAGLISAAQDSLRRIPDQQGQPNKAVRFDGAVPLMTHKLALGASYTIATWVRVNGTAVANVISSLKTNFALSIHAEEGVVRFSNHSGDQIGDSGQRTHEFSFWSHLALTVSADMQTIYVNGEPRHSFVIDDISINDRLVLGNHFSGDLSQLLIFPSTLSDEQVLKLSQNSPFDVNIKDYKPEVFQNAPRDTQVYPVVNALDWHIFDTGKSEYLRTASRWIRLNSSTIHTLSGLIVSGIDNLFTLDAQKTKEDSFTNLLLVGTDTAQIIPSETLDFEGANGLYYWELFFHMPFLVAQYLSTAQQFEDAQKWYHYIFDPAAGSDGKNDHSRFIGLTNNPAETFSEEVTANLTSKAQLEAYYRDPFDPHAIARLRPIAYQRSVLMHYTDNLISWADQLFLQDTRETLVEATLLYIMAYDLLGKKPINLGVIALPAAETLGSLKDDFLYGKIPEFLMGAGETASPQALHNAVANPHNFIPNLYFGIPQNDYFLQYWDKIEQRLRNIRYNLTIDGKPNHLPLFAPPISPSQLVQAVASGQSINQALTFMAAQPPYYRFSVMLEKARGAANAVIQFGSALLNALEKADGEQLSQIRSTHEHVLLNMNRLARENQFQIAKAGLEGLKHGLAAAAARKSYYENLIRKGLLDLEQNQISLENDAITMQQGIEMIKFAVTAAYLIPTVYGLADGDLSPGDAANQAVQIIETHANMKTQQSNVMAANAQFYRRAEEWDFQKSLADEDIEQINQQIEAATQQITIAAQDLALLETNLSQSSEIDSFLRTKYTNKELYQWMVSKLSVLYFQSYQLAFDLALSAEKAWQYERGHEQVIIQGSLWSDLHQGLLAGESLLLSLHQLEKAYLDQGERRLEIVKTIPLSSLDSHPLDELRQNGKCAFSLTQAMYDKDHKNHYCRQIKSISLSVPAVLGPYENIHAMLTQTGSKVYMQSGENGLRRDWRANQQIALSQGLNDSGLFELNFHDERYLPFEGTGAISDWVLEIPKESNPSLFIAQNSLTEVIIEVRYTACIDNSL